MFVWLVALTIAAVMAFRVAIWQQAHEQALLASLLIGGVVMAWTVAALGALSSPDPYLPPGETLQTCTHDGARMVCDGLSATATP